MSLMAPILAASLLAIPMSGFGPLCINVDLQPSGSKSARCIKAADTEAEDEVKEEIKAVASAKDDADSDDKSEKKSRKLFKKSDDDKEKKADVKDAEPVKGSSAAPATTDSSERVAGTDRGD